MSKSFTVVCPKCRSNKGFNGPENPKGKDKLTCNSCNRIFTFDQISESAADTVIGNMFKNL